MKMFDFECNACHGEFEALVRRDEDLPICPHCESLDTKKLMSSFKTFSTIIPDYPGAKKKKAGYVHTHADRPKTPGKIQVGYSGPSVK